MTTLPEKHQTAATGTSHCEPAGTKAAPFIGCHVSDVTYRQVVEILLEEQNFHLEGYKDQCIRRRLAARMRASGSPDAEDYISLLRADVQEQEYLLAALSVHVSQFFRNMSLFNMLEKSIVPQLLERARQERSKLRIWSVGCAYGEEPYSLALLFRKHLEQKDLLSIIATDLSSEALRQARQGCFPADRINQVPTDMVREFFVEKERKYQLDEKIRQMVQFFRHDILTDQPFYRAELILCRNLLIYFSREQQKQILEKLAEALLPGGYLVLGRAETLAPACRELFHCVDPAERIYQRIVTDGQLHQLSKMFAV